MVVNALQSSTLDCFNGTFAILSTCQEFRINPVFRIFESFLPSDNLSFAMPRRNRNSSATPRESSPHKLYSPQRFSIPERTSSTMPQISQQTPQQTLASLEKQQSVLKPKASEMSQRTRTRCYKSDAHKSKCKPASVRNKLLSHHMMICNDLLPAE